MLLRFCCRWLTACRRARCGSSRRFSSAGMRRSRAGAPRASTTPGTTRKRTSCRSVRYRAGEMIPEVRGTSPWGPSRKRVPKCLKGPETTYTTIAIAENSPREVKRAHFRYTLGLPGSHPGNGINGARRGRSLPPPPPPPVSPAMVIYLPHSSRFANINELLN